MIITSEHFHSRLQAQTEIAQLRAFLAEIFESVRVCCYFREQSDMALSRYSTYLKGDHTLSLSEFLQDVTPRRTYYNFDRIAGLWSQAFGREACDFRIYDRSTLQQGDIRTDFISALKRPVDMCLLDMSVAISNESLSEEEAALYRLINKQVPYWRDGEAAVEPYNLLLKRLISEVDASQRPKLSSQKLEEVRARFDGSNRTFFANYFNAEQTFPLKEVIPAAASERQDISISGEYVGQLLSHAYAAKIENRRLVSEIQQQQSENKLARIVARHSRLDYRLVLTKTGELRTLLRLALLNKDQEPYAFAKWLFYKRNGTMRKVFRGALSR